MKTAPTARFVSTLGNFALPAFTGRTQPPHEFSGNIWGPNTLPQLDFDQRRRENAFFWRLSPSQRLDVMQRRGYTHVARLAPAEEPQAWVDRAFPQGDDATRFPGNSDVGARAGVSP